MLTEKQLKYQNKVKLIAFIIMVSGLLLVLLWSIKRKDEAKEKSWHEQDAAHVQHDPSCCGCDRYDDNCDHSSQQESRAEDRGSADGCC